MPKKKAPIPEYSDEARDLFSDYLKSAARMIYYQISSREYIRQHEYDDFFQEVVCDLWEKFHSYDPAFCSFRTWAYRRAEWSISGYLRKCRKYDNRTNTTDDLSMYSDIGDVTYDESHLISLRRAISDMPAKEARVVQMYLNGEDLSEKSIADGRPHHYYVNRMVAARKWIINNRHRYFEGISVEPRKLMVVPNGRTSDKHHRSRRIQMLTLDGEVVAEWLCANDAERAGIARHGNISKCLKGERFSAGGYRWRFSGDYSVAQPRTRQQSGRAPLIIEQCDLSGNPIQQWMSMAEVIRNGFPKASIQRSLKSGKPYRDFIWRKAK